MNEPNLNRRFYLPRLPREYYQGDAVVHWTLPIFHRRQGWLDERFHSAFREMLLHTAAREGLFCPTYCLMPDHLHLVWMGLRPDSDQLNGMAFLRAHLEPKLAPQKFQQQGHDHVLKEEERRRNAPSLQLRPGKSAASRTGEASDGMDIQQRGRARLPDSPSAPRRFLAEVLEAVRSGEAPGRGENPSPSYPVAADVRRLTF